MSASTILDKDCDDLQHAMAVALLRFSRAHQISYAQIGKIMERGKQSVDQYINTDTEMPATCWLKAVAKWPELQDRFLYELDDAEKAFQAKQRSLNLQAPAPQQVAA